MRTVTVTLPKCRFRPGDRDAIDLNESPGHCPSIEARCAMDWAWQGGEKPKEPRLSDTEKRNNFLKSLEQRKSAGVALDAMRAGRPLKPPGRR